MKVLVFWDIYGRIWRSALKKEIWALREKYNPDFVLVNIDNISSGRGAIEKHIREMEDLDVSLMMWWDHILDNMPKITDYLNSEESKVIRPANFLEQDYYPIAGKGYKIIKNNGKRLLVIHVLGSVFMNHVWVDNPYIKVEKILQEVDENSYDAVVVDFHKEASSEWYAMAHFLEKTPAFIFGTHTHVQTNDELIFPSWVGVIGDVGMTWPLYSVIWADFHSVRKRMLTGIQKGKIEQCLDKNYVVNGIFVEFGKDKKCVNLEKFRIRDSL